MRCVVTRLIVDAMRVAWWVHFSTRDCERWKGNIIDSIATIQDGPPMLEIVLHASANSELDFSLVLLLPLVEALSSARNS